MAVTQLLTRHRLRRRFVCERGISLLTALMVTFVIFTAGAVWVGVATHQVEASAYERNREAAFSAAESAINDAMARLSYDAQACNDYELDLDGDGKIEAEVFFDPTLPCNDPTLDIRYIIARGYSPDRDAPRAQKRQLEQQVRLIPEQGFTFALFTSPGGLTAGQNMTINGDVFASQDLNLANSSKIFGDVVSLGSVTVNNNTVIGGKVHAMGNVTLTAAGATVGGDVWTLAPDDPSPGVYNVNVQGWVKGNIKAAGDICPVPPAAGAVCTGQIDGEQSEFSAPPPPRSQTLPTFDPTSLTYASTYFDAVQWKDEVWTPAASPNTGSLSGNYRLEGATVGPLSLDKRWNIGGDLTIVSDGPLDLSRDIVNTTDHEVTLAFISLSSASNAVSMTNNLSLPQNIHILFFAPNGCADFRNLKHFTGTVYAGCIITDNQFTLTFFPVAHDGFSWTLSSAGSFSVEAQVFREVQFSG